MGGFFVRSQPQHQTARNVLLETRQRGEVYTTNYVITELAALMIVRFHISRRAQIAWIDAVRNAEWVRTIHVDPEMDEAAWELCKARPDKRWSLVDCASFMAMKRAGLWWALTSDHHFEQAGFVRLLK